MGFAYLAIQISTMLIDNHGRKINYLRLAVTDRCNLRCFYCMPQEGIKFVKKDQLLSYEEMLRLITLLGGLGVNKVRITGGEPFVRKGVLQFMEKIGQVPSVTDLHLTTNGTLTSSLVPELKKIGVNSVNLSIDSLDKERFMAITRRKSFDEVMKTFDELIAHDIPTKLNMVVMRQKNVEDIIPMIELARSKKISVRFLEEMPFNGVGKRDEEQYWGHAEILNYIQSHYPDLEKIPDPPHSTSMNYRIPGYEGSFGIIASYSRLFCGTCNRIRLTPTGVLKTCLYDDGIFNVRDFMRAGASDDELITAFRNAIGSRAVDGFEAEKNRLFNKVSESMATIGG